MTVRHANERKAKRLREEISDLEAQEAATRDGEKGPLRSAISGLQADLKFLEHLLEAEGD